MCRCTGFRFALFVYVAICGPASGSDWPTFRHDNWRSGMTDEAFPTNLQQSWRQRAIHPPRQAWPRNFRENPYSGEKIRTVLNFDHTFQPVIASGLVLWGSSADHKVYCVDADSGRRHWDFFTEGPVRFAPTIAGERVYVGSDDGFVYCLDLRSGRLVWKSLVGPSDSRLPGNEQIISRWPVRSGVVVQDGVALCAAGLFPHREGVYLVSFDATSGAPRYREGISQVSQGYLTASASVICVPSGKASPGIYDRQTGAPRGRLQGQGTFALIREDTLFAGAGPVEGSGVGVFAKQSPSERIASFAGDELLLDNSMVYLRAGTVVAAKSRTPYETKRVREKLAAAESALAEASAEDKTGLADQVGRLKHRIEELEIVARNAREWTRSLRSAEAMIGVGDAIVVGGEGRLEALDAATGETLWESTVDGKAIGLAFANGRLVVGTDRGEMVCFSQDSNGADPIAEPASQTAVIRNPSASAIQAAEMISAALDQRKGYCLVLGDADGDITRAVAGRTQFTVVQVATSELEAERLRREFDRELLYGRRIVVHTVELSDLPYPDRMFNAVVSVARRPELKRSQSADVARLVRPRGALAVVSSSDEATRVTDEAGAAAFSIVDQQVVDGRMCSVYGRSELEGAGDWSHQYATPGNTSCSNDAVITRALRLQWFGRPGPYRMFDRHSYTASPVSGRGRVFTLGEKILYGNDAYNGTLLWELELPELDTRVNLPRDCGFMATDAACVYVAVAGKCLCIDCVTGKITGSKALPLRNDDQAACWGYVSVADGLLFGSGVRPGSFYDDGRGPWYDDSGLGQPEYSLKVLSDFLFAMPKDGSHHTWRYDGVVINSTITLGGGRIYFLENRRQEVLANPSRRLAGGDEWMELFLVALNNETGEVLWERKHNFETRTPVCFLSYKDETLVLVRSPGRSTIAAYDAATGESLWEQAHDWEQNHHGGHRRHPVLLRDVVYQQPHAYDLRTGEQRWSTTHYGGNCGTISACNNLMFSRLGNFPGLIEFGDKTSVDNLVETTRPGCWINIIPSEGMVLVPEAGSGCSCEYPMHASMGFLPTTEEN